MQNDTRQTSERKLVFLIGAVQFINILDFVMVMPLGPDFAKALGIPASNLGLIGGSYTASAAVAGVVGSFFLDRFDRRKALAVTMLGLVFGTLLGALSHGLVTLMAARVVAGAFGGPATSVSMSIIADVVPIERRGRALGAVMGAFSVASILGVPAGLELARVGGWRLPFIAVSALGLAVTIGAIVLLPALRGHLHAAHTGAPGFGEMLKRPIVVSSYVMTWTVMMAGFVVIPNISSYIQFNLGFARKDLGTLYFAGGLVSFVAMRLVGKGVDRFGSFRVGSIGSLALIAIVYAGFVMVPPPFSLTWVFMLFMLAMSLRNVSYNTLTSRVPRPHERARFMSLQSAVQHLASAAGAIVSSLILSQAPDGRLVGMSNVAYLSIALSAALPALLFAVERRVTGGAGLGAEISAATSAKR